MLRRFKKGEYVCDQRSTSCPEDCPHLHLHLPEDELTLDGAGVEVSAPCCSMAAPCPLRLAEAVVKKCVPPTHISV